MQLMGVKPIAVMTYLDCDRNISPRGLAFRSRANDWGLAKQRKKRRQ
jgi:hypothetical protein